MKEENTGRKIHFVCGDSSIRLGAGASVNKCCNLHNVFLVLKMAAVPLLSHSHGEKSVRAHQHMSRTVNRTRAGEWETTARVHTLPAIPSLLLYIYYIVVKSMCVIHAACMITIWRCVDWWPVFMWMCFTNATRKTWRAAAQSVFIPFFVLFFMLYW